LQQPHPFRVGLFILASPPPVPGAAGLFATISSLRCGIPLPSLAVTGLPARRAPGGALRVQLGCGCIFGLWRRDAYWGCGDRWSGDQQCHVGAWGEMRIGARRRDASRLYGSSK